MPYVGGQHVLSKQSLVSLRDSASSLTHYFKYKVLGQDESHRFYVAARERDMSSCNVFLCAHHIWWNYSKFAYLLVPIPD